MTAHRLTARSILLTFAAAMVFARPCSPRLRSASLGAGAVPAQLIFPIVGKVSY